VRFQHERTTLFGVFTFTASLLIGGCNTPRQGGEDGYGQGRANPPEPSGWSLRRWPKDQRPGEGSRFAGTRAAGETGRPAETSSAYADTYGR
jgi:hypothetical protein